MCPIPIKKPLVKSALISTSPPAHLNMRNRPKMVKYLTQDNTENFL